MRPSRDWQAAAQGTGIAELARAFRLVAAYAEALAENVDQETGIALPQSRASARPANSAPERVATVALSSDRCDRSRASRLGSTERQLDG